MIPVIPAPEPAAFDRQARSRGQAWLSEHPDARRPKDYWSPFRPDLEHAFRRLCGYAAMLDPTGGTVDHFLSFETRPDLAYEWSNYRFASQSLNAIKQNADATVLDPFEVGPGWFEIILPSLQLRVTDAVPPELREKAEFTLRRLKLRDGERVIRWRQGWYEMYVAGRVALEGLEQVAPLIADAVRREAAAQS